MHLTSAQLRTVQLGPLWVLSALTGTSRFGPDDLQAFWDGLVQVTLGLPEPGRGLLTSMTADRPRLLEDFAADERPVVSGLSHVVTVLGQLEPPAGEQVKTAMLRIGIAVGRARGPYGRQLTFEDNQRLLLVAQLLELEARTATGTELLV
jgi:hypothetical protein